MELPDSLEDIAALMHDNLPAGMTLAEFGKRIGWGRGSEDARKRMQSITPEEARQVGLVSEQAMNWAIAYEAVLRLLPANPSAAGRAELMRHVAQLTGGA